MKRRKWALGIGLAAMVGAAFWMRELASWRPKVFGQLRIFPAEFRVSRDGRFLWARDFLFAEETFIVHSFASNGQSQHLSAERQAFHAQRGRDTFPRLWRDDYKQKTYFARRAGEKAVVLRDVFLDYGSSTGWSLERREIFIEERGRILIWNMNDGQLKRRVRYSKWISQDAIFSPGGKWLLAVQPTGAESSRAGLARVRRYEVQSGKRMPSPDFVIVRRRTNSLQFSPDGKYLLVGGQHNEPRALVFDTSQWKQLWSDDAVVNAGWSPDNRVGLAKTDKFEWRDPASGKVLQSLPGPAKGTKIWTTSPKGDWIYAVNDQYQILRWRAR